MATENEFIHKEKGDEEDKVRSKITLIPKVKVSEMLQWLWGIASHPITGIILCAIIAFSVYLVSRKEKSPVYVVSPPETIAQIAHGEEGLSLFWMNNEIKNAASVKIGFWNDGSAYIDKKDLSTTNPIRIMSPDSVDILSVQVLRTSRPTLKFNTKIEENKDGKEFIIIGIEGDEALEKFDGVLFNVLFSGSMENAWKIIGRIKGVSNDFKEKDWFKAQKPKDIKFLILIVFLLFGFFASIYLITIVGKEIKQRKVLLCFIIVMYALSLLGWVLSLMEDSWYIWIPSWLFV